MKKIIFAMVLSVIATNINAQLVVDSLGRVGVVTIDGLGYFLCEKNHEAIVSSGNKWHGKLHIPSEVTFDRQTYKTTGLNWNSFHDCSELTYIKIPHAIEDVTHYSNNYEKLLISSDFMNPFVGCTALESIEVDEDSPSMKSVDGVLFSKDGTRLYCYPAGIKATSYVVPQGVTWIGINALANANLKKLDFPESVRTICHPTFSGCSLDEVVIRGILDEQCMNRYLFYGLSESAKLYVPASEVDRYKSIYSGTVLPLEEYIEELVTFTQDLIATIILPTEPDASKGRYYRLDRCEKGQIIFEEEQQPQARTPYIIVPNDDFSINPSTLDLEGFTQDEVSIEGISFIGSYIGKVLPSLEGDGGGSYYDIIDKTPDCGLSSLGETGKGAFIGVLRAYLQVPWDEPYNPGGTKGPEEKMEIVLKDNPNGIETIQNPMFKVQNDRGIFDLQGRKVTTDDSSLKKGVYIKGGKKMLKR